MAKITIEIDAVEALYAVNSISCVQRAIEKVARKDKVYRDRDASLELLKDALRKSLKEQSTIDDLKKGVEVIESK
jgi:hypothetical protein